MEMTISVLWVIQFFVANLADFFCQMAWFDPLNNSRGVAFEFLTSSIYQYPYLKWGYRYTGDDIQAKENVPNMTQSQMLYKFRCDGGTIFNVVLGCKLQKLPFPSSVENQV